MDLRDTLLEFFDWKDIDMNIKAEEDLSIPITYIGSVELLLKHFDHLWYIAYPDRGNDSYHEHRRTVEDGTWNNLGGLLEHAIHKRGGIEKFNTVGKDYIDISDAKLISVRISSKGTNYSAPVTNIKKKRGLLRVVCYERKLDKFYYFLIPYSAYKHIPSSSNIEIPFNMDGTPRRINNCKVNWWDYEMDTFDKICVIDSQNLQNISLPGLDSVEDSKNRPNELPASPCN